MKFKFRFVDDGKTVGFLRSPTGRVGDSGLELDDSLIDYGQIGETVTRGDRVAIQVDGEGVPQDVSEYLQNSVLVLEPRDVAPRRLESVIDQRCSAVRLQERRRRAREQGREHLIRSESCPTCGSEVDLTDLDESRYVYCPFCDTIFDREQRTSLGRQYRTCDDCGLFGRVQPYPEFFFYFLVVVYGFEYKQRFLCGVCAHRLFVKALLLNLIFVIGVPTAIWVKIKSVVGGKSGMTELRRANKLAEKGQLAEAADLYSSVLAEYPEHPGILYNMGLTRLKHGDGRRGLQTLERALTSCPNYHPLLRTVSEIEQQLRQR